MIMFAYLEKHFQKRTPSIKRGVSPRPSPDRGTDAETRSTGGAAPGSSCDVMMPHVTDDEPEDFATALAHKARRDRHLSWTLVQLSALVVCAWTVGAATDLGAVWKMVALICLLATVGGVWRASLVDLADDIIHYESARVRRRRALRQDETAEWVNFLINRWWVFSSPSLFSIVKERLEPLLNEAKPSIVESLELRQFTLGDQTPYVKSVRVFDVTQGRRVVQNSRSLQFPPSGLAANVHHQMALEADVSLDSDDFRLVLRTRLFGKGVGMDLDLAMEKLNINGKLYATCTLNMESPFPHITHISLTFVERPEVWFSIRILKAVQMMAVPVLKSWIHSVVMEALVTSLVDPGKLDINLTPHDRPSPGQETGNPEAQGVVTVTLSIAHTGPMADDVRWLSVTLGGQRCVTSQLTSRWQESPSFLVSSLLTDSLVVKLKSKRLVSAITLAHFDLPLNNYSLEHSHVVETVLSRKVTRSGSSNVPSIAVRLEYTPLPSIQLDQPDQDDDYGNTVSGVLFVYVHGAVGLTNNSDQGGCNPYCMVFNNRKKVKTTHYLAHTVNPQWEARTQFLVADRSQVSLSFVVCSWSPNKMADTDLLGLAILNLSQDEGRMTRRTLALNGNGSVHPASIVVSVVFRAVPSVAQSPTSRRENGPTPAATEEEDMVFNRGKRNSNTWMQQAKMLLIHRDPETSSDISSMLSSGLGLMEVTLIRAQDLVSKDLNGFSDPYCELKVGGECKYKSTVKKKTLNPWWGESCIMNLPRPGGVLDVVLWDHDTFGMKDYLGSVSFSLEDIRRMSSSDVAQCCQLQGVKTGSVEVKVKVISEEAELPSLPPSVHSSTSSPRSQRRMEVEPPLSRRPSGGGRHQSIVPPPTPPRTVTLTGYKLPNSQQPDGASRHSSRSSSPLSVPTVTVTDIQPDPVNSVRHSPNSLSPTTADGHLKKHMAEYSSFRVMKQKVKNGLKLRRFRSEVCVHDKSNGKMGNGDAMYNVEPSGGGESDATELLQMAGLSHAVSQPNILQRLRRPMDLKVVSPHRPDRYTGVEGKVIQVQGLHVARVAQLYCRVKFHSCSTPDKHHSGGGKTLCKSRLLPAMPNLRLDLPFQLDHVASSPRQAELVFEIRSAGKEVVATRTVTLHELLQAAPPDTCEAHTWLALNNGASLEIRIAHNREIKKQSRKLFRSWSVHRIGKI